MTNPTKEFSYLWNGLPFDERNRLMPYMIEFQKLHIWQCKQKAITAHKRHMAELDDWLKGLDYELKRSSMVSDLTKPEAIAKT